jgi:hypothetical protein
MPPRPQQARAGLLADDREANDRDEYKEDSAIRAEVRDNKARADRQLDLLYKAMPGLHEVDWHIWQHTFVLQAYAFDWHPQIWNLSVQALTTAEILEEDKDKTPDGVKKSLDRRNAFLAIMRNTSKHTVSNLLETTNQGDARMAFNTLSSFFNPTTTAGTQQALRDFFVLSMAQSGSNIISWIACVSRAARNVRHSGGEANEDSELSVLMGGLLPEFNPIRDIINNRVGREKVTLAQAVVALTDFARQHQLLTLCKGSTTKGGNNIFYVNENSDIPISEQSCINWSKYRCASDPGTCLRKHVGQGGCVKDYPQNETS